MSMPFIKASHTKRHQAVTDVIESVALEEAALAHILNAEGEELQKILCFHNLSVEELICANKSITEVIKAVTELEEELHDKLEVFKHCLCSPFAEDDQDDDEPCEE